MPLFKIKNRYISIGFGLATIITIIVLTTSIFISIIFFVSIRKTMREEIKTRLHDIVSLGVKKIDVDLHSTLKKPEQENSEAYKIIKKSLQDIKDSTTGVGYVYTMRRIGEDKYIFIVDAEEKPEYISHLGDIYAKDLDLEEAFNEKNKICVPGRFTPDKWGIWMSGFAHLYTKSGKFDGILGVDISADYIIKQEREVFLRIVYLVATIVIVFVFITLLLSKKISRPLSILEKDMIEIKELKLNTPINIDTVFKEVINIKNAVDSMKIGLRSFKKYISPDLVNQIIQKNIEATLGGEKKELTIFFSDIANFTSISEALEPELIAEYMKDYFGGLTRIIIKHNGTIDKYIGDSIMAFWGAPNEIKDHIFQAVCAALECQEYLQKLNLEQQNNKRPVLTTRIGISTGEVVIGNFGYEERLDYTVFGDPVNLTQRLEGLNKIYGTKIIISEDSYKRIRDKVIARKLDFVAVKGKTKGVFIYELVGLKDQVAENVNNFVNIFNVAIEYYFEKKWEKAIEVFSVARQLKPNDKAIDLMVNRCRDYIKNPPPENWQGLTVLTEK